MSNTTEQIIPTEESVSRPNHLKFISFEVENYAGLDYSEKSLVVYFPENENIAEFSGDQGMGKTSLMAALKTLMGEPEPPNATNSKTKAKSASLTFELDGERYKSRVTNKSYTLTNIREVDGKPVVSDIKKPKDMLASFIQIGVNPSFLQKKKSGEEQLDWIKSLGSSNPALADKETKIKADYDKSYKERTGVNRDVATLKTALVDCGYYVWYDKGQVFTPTTQLTEDKALVEAAPENDSALKEAYDAAYKTQNELTSGQSRFEQLNTKEKTHASNIEGIDKEIARLMAQKAEQQTLLQDTKDAIEKAHVWIKEREDAPAKFAKAQEDLQNSAKIATTRQALELASQALTKFIKAEKDQQDLNTKLTDFETQLASLAKEYTPDIEGLEVELGGNIDNPRAMGVYYKGVNISYLSESELWDLCLQVWRVSGISVVFIENSTSLGTDAISRVNWFAENGGKVFVSTLMRGYKELVVSFHTDLK